MNHEQDSQSNDLKLSYNNTVASRPVSYGMKIIIANWKNNPSTLAEAKELFNSEIESAKKYSNVQTIILPSDKFLEQLTGSAMRTDYVLVGHSSRREEGETDEIINKKLKIALEGQIIPILFVGEREGESRENVLTAQLTKDLAGLSVEQISKILFTYEPVWAISTNPGGHPDTPENALAAIRFINDFLTKNYKLKTINYLYGGSVNEKNVGDFLQHPEISGAVIGQASLNPNQFEKILEVTSRL